MLRVQTLTAWQQAAHTLKCILTNVMKLYNKVQINDQAKTAIVWIVEDEAEHESTHFDQFSS